MSETLKENADNPNTTKTDTFSPFLIATFLLTLVAVAISVYAVWRVSQTQVNTFSRLKQSESTNHAFLQTKLDAFNISMKDLKEESARLKDNITTIARKQNQDENSWQLIKAQHLIDIAALSLYWEKTIHPALGLLEAADKLVQALNDPSYTPLRQTLSDEILALKAIPDIDTVGLLSTLDSLSNTIPTLPLNTDSITPTTSDVSDKNDTPSLPGWRKTLDDSLETMSKLVVIRYRKETLIPLLSPAERQSLIDQIKLTLQQAEWAIIQKNKGLYTLSIDQAIKLISSHFKTSDNGVNTLLDSLSTLKKQDIAPTLPDVQQSKTMIDALIKQSKEVSV